MSKLIDVSYLTPIGARGYSAGNSQTSIYIDADDILAIEPVDSSTCIVRLTNGVAYTVNESTTSLASKANTGNTTVVQVSSVVETAIRRFGSTVKQSTIWIGAQHVVEILPIDSSKSSIKLSNGAIYTGLEDDPLQTLAQRLTISLGGGGGGAPTTAQYVTLATNATLTNERVLTAGGGISITDNGAGSTVVIAANGIISQALNETQTGTTELHIGSYKFESGSVLLSTSAAMIGCLGVGDTCNLRLRRFTGGSVIATWSRTGLLGESALGSNVTLSSTDWYDLYLYSGGATQTAVVKGLRILYTI